MFFFGCVFLIFGSQTGLQSREELLAALHAGVGEVVVASRRVVAFSESDFTIQRDSLSENVLQFIAEQLHNRDQMQKLDAKKIDYHTVISDLEQKISRYKKWIEELIRYATEVSGQAATFFFSDKGKKPFEINFEQRRAAFFAKLPSVVQVADSVSTEDDLGDDLKDAGILDLDDARGDMVEQGSECSVVDPVQSLYDRVSSMQFSDSVQTHLVALKRQLEAFKRSEAAYVDQLKQVYKEVEGLLLERTMLSECCDKYLSAERKLAKAYGKALQDFSTRANFAKKWAEESAEIRTELLKSLEPKNDVFKELELFSELAVVSCDDVAKKAMSEGGRVSLYSRHSFGARTF